MPDEYDAFRRNLTSYEKGLYFELGRAHELGETPDKGWVRQFRMETTAGVRVLDNGRSLAKGIHAKERKSGRLNEADVRQQLWKERAAFEAGLLVRSDWETVAGEKETEQTRENLRAMARDFGGFQRIVVSREDALRQMRLGQSLASKQLELFKSYELQRADRARERLANIRLIVRAKERAEKFQHLQQAHQRFRDGAERGRAEAPARIHQEQVQAAEQAKAREQEARDKPGRELADKKAALAQALEDQARHINESRDKGKAIDLAQVREAHAELSKGLKEIREAERAQALEMLTAAGYTPAQAQTMQAMLEQERERQQRQTIRGIDYIGAIVEREDKAADKARAAEKAPAKEIGRELTEAEKREKAERERVAELQRLYREGQARPPQAAAEIAPERAPGVVRGGTSRDQGRDRGQSRDR